MKDRQTLLLRVSAEEGHLPSEEEAGDKLQQTIETMEKVKQEEFLAETRGVREGLRRVRLESPNSVSFLALTEFRGESSVSSSQLIICVTKRTHAGYSPSFPPSLPQNSVRLSEFSSQCSRNSVHSTTLAKSLVCQEGSMAMWLDAHTRLLSVFV